MKGFKEVKDEMILDMYEKGNSIDYITEYVAEAENEKLKEARKRVESLILELVFEKAKAR
nr:MAG TPA: hypothetical protein [Caudoviricetes sp.]